MRSTLRRGAVVVFGAAAALSLGLGSALADPNLDNQGNPQPGGFLPDANDVVVTGSDTIQYLTNELSRGYNGAGDVRLASFNAFKPGTEASPVTGDPIQIRPGVTIPRPNGSSAGIRALLDPTSGPNLDGARSSRPSTGTPAEDTLSFIPFASDGLSYIIDDTSDVPTNLTAADLRDIYTCQLPGFAAKLPQAGSGTRQFFLQRINVSEEEIALAVEAGCVDDTVQEHDPAAVDGDALALAPFSEARFRVNPVNPGSPPSSVVDLASDAGTGGFHTTRDVFHVVKDSAVNTARIQDVFGPSGLICTALADGEQGFTTIGNRCGVAVPDV